MAMGAGMEIRNQAFTLRVFVANGDPDGLRIVERSNWVGRAVVFPRSILTEVKKRPEFFQTGVYLLIGPGDDGESPRLYVGEGDPVRPRLESHHAHKDFWTSAIFFVSTQGQLNKAHVQFLEARLIALAKAAKRAELDNSQAPAEPFLSEPDVAEMEVFLGNMLGMLPVLGVTGFDKPVATSRQRISRLFLKAKGVTAEGYESTQGFTVLAGSTAVVNVTASFNVHMKGASSLREQLIRNGILVLRGDAYVFSDDYSFSAPSMASTVVIGNASNGRISWKDKNGRTLKEIQESESSER